MANYRANDVIRLTRKAVGLSQEAISEGICSVETFSRIERGKTKIKGDCEFPYKSRVMGTSEPLKPLKAPYMARNPG